MASSRRHIFVRGRTPWLFLALSALASSVGAHDMWIVPPAAATAGEAAEIRLRVGHAGDQQAVRRDGRRLVRFDAVGPAGAALTVPGLDGADPAGVFRPDQEGLWTIVYESHDAFSELPADRFRGYLQQEGLGAILDLRRQRGEDGEPGRELYSRSLKSLVPVFTGGRGGSEPTVDRAIGLPLELVIETEPTLWAAGRLQLRLWLRGEPLGGALVDVRNLENGETAAALHTDGDGRVDLELGPGTWIAAVVHMQAEETSPRADWRSLFATLTWVISHPGE